MNDINSTRYLRELASQVADIATSSENKGKRELWRDSNSLTRSNRIPIFCELFDTWPEILPKEQMLLDDPFLVEMEYKLKQILYKYNLGDDDVVEPWYPLEVISNLGKDRGVGLWGLSVTRDTTTGRGWVYHEHPVQDEKDLDLLKMPKLEYNKTAVIEAVSRAESLIGDILPIQLTLGMADRQWAKLHSWATALCGMEQLYISMLEKPDFIHQLMHFMMNGMLSLMDQCEQEGILCQNNYGRLTCDSLPNKIYDSSKIRFSDIWGRGESQEFDGISPEMFYEFLLQYQMPILSRFGIINYGCCENLTDKIEYIMKIPNLRQFICSHWTKLEKVVSLLEDKYVIEWRQSASEIIGVKDFNELRTSFEKKLELARGCHIQVHLDSVMTLGGKPDHLKKWVIWAKKITEQYS